MSPRRTAPPRQLDRFYTVKQAAKWLIPPDPDDPDDENSEAGERWLRDGVNHKGWPHHRFGRRLMFSESDLAEIAQCHRNAPTRAGRPRTKPARIAA
jgi:hypothetical protein